MRSEKDREYAITAYKRILLSTPILFEAARRELKGKDLSCYCYPKLCHGDVLM